MATPKRGPMNWTIKQDLVRVPGQKTGMVPIRDGLLMEAHPTGEDVSYWIECRSGLPSGALREGRLYWAFRRNADGTVECLAERKASAWCKTVIYEDR